MAFGPLRLSALPHRQPAPTSSLSHGPSSRSTPGPGVNTRLNELARAGTGILTSGAMASSEDVKMAKVAASELFTSEPDPGLFGNQRNPSPKTDTWTNDNWLKSRFHFSFAEYRDPRNQNFGPLRVMNDDLVQPSRGFGAHGHSDAEICTYVVDGELTHQDSMGTSETLQHGAIQFMSAGKGVRHSEHNRSPDKPLRFIQMWITPAKRGLEPNYGSAPGDPSARHNQWYHMVSDVRSKDTKTPVEIYQDINMYITEMDAGVELPLALGKGRQAYLLCVEGTDATVVSSSAAGGTVQLSTHDAAKIVNDSGEDRQLTVKASAGNGTHILVVEMLRS